MTEARPLAELLSALIEQIGTLFQKEVALARSETGEHIAAMAGSLVVCACGTALIAIAVHLLLQAAVLGLRLAGLPAHWSLVVVAGAALLVGAMVLAAGLRTIQGSRLGPRRTAQALRRDVHTVKEELT